MLVCQWPEEAIFLAQRLFYNRPLFQHTIVNIE
jgi:hypothetical protein